MVLIIMPALDGLKTEWREAAEMLGATHCAVLAHGGVPGALAEPARHASLLLFANAFGAVATAYALTGSSLNIVPILLYAQIRGDVLHDPQSRLRAGARHDRHHRRRQRRLHLVAPAQRAVAANEAGRLGLARASRFGALYSSCR